MSYLPNVMPLDAFTRVRTSDPETIFDSTHHYDKSPLLWEETVVAGGSGTHLPNEACVRMRVSNSGDSVIRQSRAYHRYQPGKSQLVLMTFDAGTARTNARQRIGQFDAQNGVFLQRDGSALSLVRRTYTGGSGGRGRQSLHSYLGWFDHPVRVCGGRCGVDPAVGA